MGLKRRRLSYNAGRAQVFWEIAYLKGELKCDTSRCCFKHNGWSSVRLGKALSLPAKFRWPNITQAEKSVLLRIKECEVGYNNADKNRDPVIYSKDLYAEQCRLYLADDKAKYSTERMRALSKRSS